MAKQLDEFVMEFLYVFESGEVKDLYEDLLKALYAIFKYEHWFSLLMTCEVNFY